MAWVPLIGYFLGTPTNYATLLTSIIWASMIHFLIVASAWINFRPVFGLIMLSLTVSGFILMFYGNTLFESS
jgi:hypothetical protein